MKIFSICFLSIALVTFLSCQSPFTHLSNVQPTDFNKYVGVYNGEKSDETGKVTQFEITLQGNQNYSMVNTFPLTKKPTIYTKGTFLFTENKKYLALKSDQGVYIGYYSIEGKELKKVTIKGKTPKKISDQQILNKVDFDQQITGKYWKILTVNGKKLDGKFKKEPHIKFTSTDNAFGGYSGCNAFSGLFNANNIGRIEMSQLTSTEMYCESITWEPDLLNALITVDGYAIKNDTLQLFKAKIAPSIICVAVYF